jgi:hypothetical protein
MKNYQEFILLISAALIINFLFTLFLMTWVTDNDIKGLPEKEEGLWSRFIALFYYSITCFSTTGYGDILAVSNRARLAVGLYLIAVFSGLVSVLFKI